MGETPNAEEMVGSNEELYLRTGEIATLLRKSITQPTVTVQWTEIPATALSAAVAELSPDVQMVACVADRVLHAVVILLNRVRVGSGSGG
jgi:hypothetical protein